MSLLKAATIRPQHWRDAWSPILTEAAECSGGVLSFQCTHPDAAAAAVSSPSSGSYCTFMLLLLPLLILHPHTDCRSDMTHRFLKTNGLSMVVRSHEVEWEGYCFYHQDTVLSVFSASNYVGGGSNFGAFVQFDGATMSYTIQQFKAPPLEEYPGAVRAV